MESTQTARSDSRTTENSGVDFAKAFAFDTSLKMFAADNDPIHRRNWQPEDFIGWVISVDVLDGLRTVTGTVTAEMCKLTREAYANLKGEAL